MTFDLDKNNEKKERLWEKVESMDPADPEYTDAVRAYLDESKAASERTLEEMGRLRKRAEEAEPEDPCDEEFMEDISS